MPGRAHGADEFLLAGNNWSQATCANAVLAEHPTANAAQLTRKLDYPLAGSSCAAVFATHDIERDPTGAHRACYLYPAVGKRTICRAQPASCTGSFSGNALRLRRQYLTGSVPTQLGLLTHLEVLDVCDNAIEGGIPTQLGLLTNLVSLSLCENQLAGHVPSQLGRLSRLDLLQLYGNGLSGALPSELGLINPAFCHLIGSQWDAAGAPSTSLTQPPPTPSADGNRFECPLPALSVGCAMNGLSFGARDAHSVGTCGVPIAQPDASAIIVPHG